MRVVVFGATSAIAAECVAIYAARGAELVLVGRDPGKLAALKSRFPKSDTVQADFSQVEHLAALVDRIGGPIDVALIAHGDLGDQIVAEADFGEAERIITANFTSVVALVVPIANLLEQQRSGCLAVMGSVAGERGRPRNYTYGSAKGALHLYLQGVRSRLRPAGVAVTTLKLGPVHTPMTTTHKKNLLFARPENVARQIVAAIDARADEVFVPPVWAAIMTIVRNTPEALFQRLRFLSGR